MFCFILAIRAESLLYGLSLEPGRVKLLIANPGKLGSVNVDVPEHAIGGGTEINFPI